MKRKVAALIPGLICAVTILSVCFLEWLSQQNVVTPFQRVEWITYDWRVRIAANQSLTTASNLGMVAITDDSVEALLDGTFPYRFGLQWPREVYARVVNELHVQEAKVVGFDVLFAELRPDHAPTVVRGQKMSSDQFFARELKTAGNVIIPAEKSLMPVDIFRTNAFTIGDISAQRELDGVLRRAQAYSVVTIWHPAIRQAASQNEWKLEEARTERGRIIFPVSESMPFELPLNSQQEFDAAALDAASHGRGPASTNWARPFTRQRVWHLGIVMAAHELGLDLNNAQIDLSRGFIEFPDKKGGVRKLPVDREGRFYIDWSLRAADPRLTVEPLERLLARYELRQIGQPTPNIWEGKIVIIGSTATGNNLTDIGATPLEHDTYLVSAHLNIVNSLLMNRFVTPLSPRARQLLIIAFGLAAALLTLALRPLYALFAVLWIAGVYVAFACWVYVNSRLWLPIVLPIGGSFLITHVCLLIFLVRYEREQRQHTRQIFSKIVSPDVVGELLSSETLALGGARREITVFFADVRGFTEITDAHQQRADAEAATRQLDPRAAKEFFDAEAAEMLKTVNLYLGVVADCIKKHGGTLDKYIGDCVMAFWGAPVANPQHALSCVRAVIEIQRGVFELNEQRRARNAEIEKENQQRIARGEPLLRTLDILTIGSGINTGMATVGLMGSDAHLVNYTVFGREVNLAARLEGASGRGRILIGEQTYRDIRRDDPALAATCVEQPLLQLKGFRDAVKTYEVPWRPPEISREQAGQSPASVRPPENRDSC